MKNTQMNLKKIYLKEQTYLDEITFKIDDLEEQIEEFGELSETPITFYSSMEDALQHMHNVTTLKEQIEEKAPKKKIPYTEQVEQLKDTGMEEPIMI